MISVDARGRACPEPVIMTKNAIAGEVSELEVLVDNKTALENVKRFASKSKYAVEVEDIEDYYKLKLQK